MDKYAKKHQRDQLMRQSYVNDQQRNNIRLVEDNIMNYSPDQTHRILSIKADNYDLDAFVQRNPTDLSP